MRVLSLFDGMSVGKLALNKLGVSSYYYASEVDKYVMQVSQQNHPDIVQLGDIEQWRTWPIIWASVDLLIGGSPCQGFSFAGKQLAFDDPRSKLFFIYVDILNHIRKVNPKVKFLLENVKMKKEYLDVITERLGVEPVFINSTLVSAQYRQRYYWCNWHVEQPEDRGIFLKDIIEGEGLACVKSHGKLLPRPDKSQCLDANYHKGADNHGQRTVIVGVEHRSRGFEELKVPGKAYALTCSSMFGRKAMIADEHNYRKLTPIECERLQTLPDNYTSGVSNSQRYKMIGNGWTLEVIIHLFKGLLNECTANR